MDFTKHLGGAAATRELVELCKIDHSKYVLDVGCGVGFTPTNLAKDIGCRVVGVDFQERMIDKAIDRARRENVLDLVEYRISDACELPFDDCLFDAVIVESVLAFIPDKELAMREFVRVVKPGGYIGITEAKWTRTPSEKLLKLLSDSFGPNFEVQSIKGWEGLLKGEGLLDIVAKVNAITTRSEITNRVGRVGWKEIGRTMLRAISILVGKREYRSLLKEAISEPIEVIDYWGYGIFVGRTPQTRR